jgi:4-diphosphocytidyl-2-C-methyl-D-erythritol kinase
MLHITGRRNDGYHELETVFQMLDRGDELAFQVNNTGDVNRLTSIATVAAEDDLVVRAAKSLQQYAAVEQGVDIALRKRLPMGGGLGGGSSDAATTLVVLNQLWGCGLSSAELCSLGLSLGADVPVFVNGVSAFARGVGEQLTALSLPPAWYVVLTPDVHMSTAAVFSAPQLRRDCPPLGEDFLETMANFEADSLPQENVCEPIVLLQQKEVANALSAMAEFAPARMTGTGSSIFGRFVSEQKAQACGRYFETLGYQVLVAEGLDRSPLMTALENFQKLS